MSQIPRKTCFSRPKTITATSVRTAPDPWTGGVSTQSKTSVIEIKPCGHRASEASRGSPLPRTAGPACRCPQGSTPSTSGLRPPTQYRYEGASSGVPQPCSSIPQPGRRSCVLSAHEKRMRSTQSHPAEQQMSQQIEEPSAVPCPNSGRMPRGIPKLASRSGPIGPQAASTPIQPTAPAAKRPPSATSLRRQAARKQPKPGQKLTFEDTIREDLMEESLRKPDSRVLVKAKHISKVCHPERIETPAGEETVLQKAVLEHRVERDEEGERIYKSIISSNLDEEKGIVEKVQLGIEQLEPEFALPEGREVIGIKKTISITDTYKTTAKEYSKITTEQKLKMAPSEVAKMVEEEKEDVENTLKMIPPDLVLEPGKYAIKQRLQKLRLHSESIALLEQSIIQPEPTADEAQTEPLPEAVAIVMHNVEKGISPTSSPDQVFNSLFKEDANNQFIKLSSIAPGPLQDVVAPTDVPKDIHKEMFTDDITKLVDKINSRGLSEADNMPPTDIFAQVMEDAQKTPEKGKNKPRSYQPIKDEKSLWVNEDLEHLVNIIGAEPVDILDTLELEVLEQKENMEDDLKNGIEYFVEAEPVQYMSRIQLRGTNPPKYFPGYMVAVPDLPELITIAKNPDEVFSLAWKATQPKYFEHESTFTLSF